MPNLRTHTLLTAIMLLLLTLPACQVLEPFTGGDGPEGGGNLGGAVATAQVVGQSAATLAASAQEDGGAALATAQAMATAELPLDLGEMQFDIEALRRQFEAIELGEDGQATVTIADDQLNQVFAMWESADPLARLRNVNVNFAADGTIHLTADVVVPLVSAPLAVTFQPTINDGILSFQVLTASYGQREVPPSLLGTAGALLDNTLGQATSYLPPNVQLRQVTVQEGQMILVAGRA